MTHSSRIIVAGILLAFGICGAATAGPDDGNSDYSRGASAFAAHDYATALRDFRPEAFHGNTDARAYLMRIYNEGLGVRQNDMVADYWCNLAVAFTPTTDYEKQWRINTQRVCDFIAKGLPPEQAARAKSYAAAWSAPDAAGWAAYSVFFDYDIPNMTAEAQDVAELARFEATAIGAKEIELVGHADTAEKQPQAISLARAQAVEDYLVEHGLPETTKIKISGEGTAHPLVPTGPNAREPQNRFVTVFIR